MIGKGALTTGAWGWALAATGGPLGAIGAALGADGGALGALGLTISALEALGELCYHITSVYPGVLSLWSITWLVCAFG